MGNNQSSKNSHSHSHSHSHLHSHSSPEKYYKGEFTCSVLLFNDETREYEEMDEHAEDFLNGIDKNALEIVAEFMQKHVVSFINQKLDKPSTDQLLLAYGFGGDHGDGDGYFSVPFKLTEIPPMYFEMININKNIFKLTEKQYGKSLLTREGQEVIDEEIYLSFVMNFHIE